MHAKTALAVAGALLAIPSIAPAAPADDTQVPGKEALRASGRLTLDAEHRDRLVRAHLRLARREARLSGDPLRPGYARGLRDDAVSAVRARNERLRGRLARLERRGGASTASPALRAIAACESGGNPATDTGNGFYGKYQFSIETWRAVGGRGNPAAASEAEQDRRAAALYAQAGASPWPVCGR